MHPFIFRNANKVGRQLQVGECTPAGLLEKVGEGGKMHHALSICGSRSFAWYHDTLLTPPYYNTTPAKHATPIFRNLHLPSTFNNRPHTNTRPQVRVMFYLVFSCCDILFYNIFSQRKNLFFYYHTTIYHNPHYIYRGIRCCWPTNNFPRRSRGCLICRFLVPDDDVLLLQLDYLSNT